MQSYRTPDRRVRKVVEPSPEDQFIVRRLEDMAFERPEHAGFLRDVAQRIRDLSYLAETLRGRRVVQ
jgi:hypothetical protein